MLTRQFLKQLSRVFTCALLLLTLLWLIGCGSPRERYKVLSFFFDGVPDPDSPVLVKGQRTPSGQRVVTLAVVSRHKPFVDGLCDPCHQSATGQMLEFRAAYDNCVRCHKNVSTKYPRMHGPVAREACAFCHVAHESPYPALLKADAIQVCTQCHDAQLLSPQPAEHTDGRTPCTSCHSGHGGHAANLLKTGWQGHATTAPATSPAPAGRAGP